MGRIVARADGSQVEIIMTDDEDAAILTCEPSTAIEIAMQLLRAALTAAAR